MSSSEKVTTKSPPLGVGIMEDKISSLPQVTHEEILKNPILFMEVLKVVHSLLGTKFKVPLLSGKKLDLHRLYMEVTNRGGFEKVIVGRRWKEIGNVFEFKSTATSSSYAMKKHYSTILIHVEKFYFLKQQPPFSAPTAVEVTNMPYGVVLSSINMDFGSTSMQRERQQPQSKDVVRPYQGQANPPGGRRRRQNNLERPKYNKSGYNFFFSEKYAVLKSICHKRTREFTKIIGNAWNQLSREEKMVYEKLAVKDKDRYRKELMEYKEKKQGEGSSSHM